VLVSEPSRLHGTTGNAWSCDTCAAQKTLTISSDAKQFAMCGRLGIPFVACNAWARFMSPEATHHRVSQRPP
jgi:hypothetical protein